MIFIFASSRDRLPLDFNMLYIIKNKRYVTKTLLYVEIANRWNFRFNQYIRACRHQKNKWDFLALKNQSQRKVAHQVVWQIMKIRQAGFRLPDFNALGLTCHYDVSWNTREVTDPGKEKWIPEDVKNLVDPSLHPPENKKDERRRSVPYLFALRSEICSSRWELFESITIPI